jgi:hypothetical protein
MKTPIGSTLSLLRAAKGLSEVFSAEELVVAVWKQDKSFGLHGYTDLYPNSNKVLAALMGEKGLTRRGYFKKVGPKMYSLTPEGKALVIPTNGKVLRLRANKELEGKFLGYFDSPTRHKVETSPATVALVDALNFWGFKHESKNINQKLVAVNECLSALEALLREQEDVILSNGLALALKDIQGVRRTHEWLQEKFRRHLNLLINRNQ